MAAAAAASAEVGMGAGTPKSTALAAELTALEALFSTAEKEYALLVT